GGTAPALHRVGVDGNQIFNADGSQAIDVPALAKLGAKVVRVNFISGPWNGPADTTLHSGRTWAQATDKVVNELRGAGIGVYGLLNDELVGSMGDLLRDQSDPKAARAWIEKFAQACAEAVGQLKDRVAVFEVMNEPNDWAGGTTARVSAYWQALVLRRVYERVKLAHATDPSWQVTLLAGPEFSSVQTLGDGYLQDVFQEGIAHHGWSTLLQSSGTYPLDGVAYHIYELEDSGDAPSSVAAVFGAHLDAIHAVLQAQDPGWASKEIWISEFGWQSSTAGEQHQADMLQAGFDALLADSRVAVAIDFCAIDFPGTTWGIVGKVAASTFQANAGR
ncbi:MAG TPA: cellulase family glycosylhydrolase, partial [Planctomycetota bacterium]|nr:cellulase family glycosylhydrolase [Planctomycetota bacterium]